jgi:predicted AlkP superfamily pyrophosphatase or phosphodiesterase
MLLGLIAAIAAGLFAVPLCAADRDHHVIVVSIDGLAGYLLDDPKAPIHTVRELARQGSYVEGGMKVSNPSVTWPNHTSIIAGVRPERHGVLANGVLLRGGADVPVTVDPKRDQSDLVRVPTIIEAAHAAGLRTGEVNWPCTRGSKALDDSFPDVPDSVDHMTPRFRKELVAKGILTDETQATFMANSIAGRDLIWTDAACHLIRERAPNLLLVHLLVVDSTHHQFGAQSQAGYTANGFADLCLRKIVQAIDDAGIRDRTTLIVLADHGFILTPQAMRPNVILRQQGLLTATGNKIDEARIHVFPEGGIGLVYFTHRGEAEADRKRVKELFEGQEGVADILFPEQFAEYGLPHPREYDQAPDAVLAAKEGYSVAGTVEGETFIASHTEARTSLGSHGFLSTRDKMNAVCVLSGPRICQGAKLKGVENIDIAPTIAHLLKIEGFEADGKVLREALRDASE